MPEKILKDYFFFFLLFILTALNLIIINFPLTNVFGFESGVLNSVFIYFLTGFYFINRLKKNLSKKNFSLKEISIKLLFFLLIPFLIYTSVSLFVRDCSYTDGFLFYLILTVPSVIIGAATGAISFSISKRFSKLFFIIISIIILLIPLTEFYFNPQIYFYNPIFGYLPGTIYDEAVRPDFKLFIYRIFNIIFFGISFIILYKKSFLFSSSARIIFITFLIVISTAFLLISPLLGFSTTYSKMEKTLGGKIETPHFTIHYAKEIDSLLIKAIVLHHEYYYKELSEFFKSVPDEKITSFLFSTRTQKKELLGSGSADVAKPWLNQVYTIHYNYLETLKHEIAHVFTGKFVEGLFKVADRLNPSLIEGVAMAAEGLFDENDLHYVASLAYQNNYQVKIENLFEHFNFFSRASTLSYVYAGSFSKYLIDNFGIEKFKKFYTNLNFSSVYKKSFKEISDEYYHYLERINVKGDSAKADYYFGRTSIFYKKCPRFIAAKSAEGWEHIYNNDFISAKDIFEELLNITNEYSTLTGLAEALSGLKRKNEAINLLTNRINEFENTSYYYNISLKLADLLSEVKNFTKADSIYIRIIQLMPNQRLYYLSKLRRDLLDKNMLWDYLLASPNQKYEILRELNSEKYSYNSFPVFISLAKQTDEEYGIFLQQFNKTLLVKDFESSYGVYNLSVFMTEKLDFDRARRMAGFSSRYKQSEGFNIVLQENLNKANWFYYNAEKILSQITIN